MDPEKTGKISLELFLEGMAKKAQESSTHEEADFPALFKLLDRDSNGLIYADEIRYLLGNLEKDMSSDHVNELVK